MTDRSPPPVRSSPQVCPYLPKEAWVFKPHSFIPAILATMGITSVLPKVPSCADIAQAADCTAAARDLTPVSAVGSCARRSDILIVSQRVAMLLTPTCKAFPRCLIHEVPQWFRPATVPVRPVRPRSSVPTVGKRHPRGRITAGPAGASSRRRPLAWSMEPVVWRRDVGLPWTEPA